MGGMDTRGALSVYDTRSWQPQNRMPSLVPLLAHFSRLCAFAQDVLPKYFKHGKYASFVRQLYKYCFVKRAKGENGANADEFEHPNFVRGDPLRLALVRFAVCLLCPPMPHVVRQRGHV